MNSCNCKNIGFGTYGNDNGARTAIITPQGRKQWIDNCLIIELQSLWEMGIKTIESCCGHNKHTGYIAVYDFDIELMKSMGYVEEIRPDLFYPKSISITNKQ